MSCAVFMQVSTAVRLCDGALVVVDVVEGVCPQVCVLFERETQVHRRCSLLPIDTCCAGASMERGYQALSGAEQDGSASDRAQTDSHGSLLPH